MLQMVSPGRPHKTELRFRSGFFRLFLQNQRPNFVGKFRPAWFVGKQKLFSKRRFSKPFQNRGLPAPLTAVNNYKFSPFHFRKTSLIFLAISVKSFSCLPRVVSAGVPRRMPEGSTGERVSKGMVFLLTMIPAFSSRSLASLPPIPLPFIHTSTKSK